MREEDIGGYDRGLSWIALVWFIGIVCPNGKQFWFGSNCGGNLSLGEDILWWLVPRFVLHAQPNHWWSRLRRGHSKHVELFKFQTFCGVLDETRKTCRWDAGQSWLFVSYKRIQTGWTQLSTRTKQFRKMKLRSLEQISQVWTFSPTVLFGSSRMLWGLSQSSASGRCRGEFWASSG